MNKHAIALAADSATTVTQWIDGKEEKRYFKGANKIFQLSNVQPVGLMIFDTANLQEIPWELINKEFRNHLGDKSFNALVSYADELFDFIARHSHLYPDDYQSKIFLEESYKAASIYLYLIAARENSIKSAADTEQRKYAYAEFFRDSIASLDAKDLPAHFEQPDVDGALATYGKALSLRIQKTLEHEHLTEAVDATQLAELAIKALFKSYDQFMDSTGVVIAGYGDHEYFPRYFEYRCYGLLLSKFLYDEASEKQIEVDTPAHIKPFATKSMIETFWTGFSPDVFHNVYEEMVMALREFYGELVAQAPSLEIHDLEDRIERVVDSHTDQWTDKAMREHAWPLNRVVSSLPVEEMAELAETLIMLQSLKEKVTKPSELVGGPVDVAIISKSDGFIWIKRKHYFESKLNPRFLHRQGELYRNHRS